MPIEMYFTKPQAATNLQLGVANFTNVNRMARLPHGNLIRVIRRTEGASCHTSSPRMGKNSFYSSHSLSKKIRLIRLIRCLKTFCVFCSGRLPARWRSPPPPHPYVQRRCTFKLYATPFTICPPLLLQFARGSLPRGNGEPTQPQTATPLSQGQKPSECENGKPHPTLTAFHTSIFSVSHTSNIPVSHIYHITYFFRFDFTCLHSYVITSFHHSTLSSFQCFFFSHFRCFGVSAFHLSPFPIFHYILFPLFSFSVFSLFHHPIVPLFHLFLVSYFYYFTYFIIVLFQYNQ